MKRALSVAAAIRTPRALSVLRVPALRVRLVATARPLRRVRAPTQHVHVRRSFAMPAVPHKVVTMPALSPTMETGTLVRWAKKEGDTIEPGDLIAEVETDKATIGWESTDDGVLAKILVPAPAQGLQVGAPVAIFVKTAAEAAQLAHVTLADVTAAAEPAAAPAAAAPAAAAPATPAKELPQRVLTMPALSPTMEKGTLAKWAKEPGDTIEPGDLIAEVETDKAVIGWESTEEGVMAKQLVPSGSVIALGTPVAIMVNKKEEVAKWQHITLEDLTAAPPAPAASAPAAPAPAAPAAPPPPPAAPAAPAPRAAPSDSGRVIASPRARMEAQKRGVPLDALRGTGPGGRVIAADVLEYVPPVTRTAAPEASVSAAAAAPATTSAWATLMSESKQRVPHYYLTVELRVDALERAVATLQATHKDVTLSSALILAAARTMSAVPAVNSEWRGDVVRSHTHVDVNVLVPGAASGESVQAPVLRAVESRGLRALSDELRRVQEAASKGSLGAEEQAVGTFSVLDLSATGVQQCAPIIVPNHAAALSLGAVETRPLLDADGETVRKARVLVATLSCDHRVVDGAVGAQWLQHFKKLVEEPLTLLL